MPKKSEPPTKAEIVVLRAICQVGTVQEAAMLLQLSTHTVDKHLDNLRIKTGLHHRPQIIRYAYEHGWMDQNLDLTTFTGKKRGPSAGTKQAAAACRLEHGLVGASQEEVREP